jgi:V/A-type H+-transporting ATPase subunit F
VKLLFLGNREECLGFALAGAESVVVEDDEAFAERMERILSDSESGLVIAADRFFGCYRERFSKEGKKRAVPAVMFVPSIEGKHLERDIKGYLSSVLGIRL